MFKRLILGEYAGFFVIFGFATALTIFVAMAWSALRMNRAQARRFSELPLSSDCANTRHDTSV